MNTPAEVSLVAGEYQGSIDHYLITDDAVGSLAATIASYALIRGATSEQASDDVAQWLNDPGRKLEAYPQPLVGDVHFGDGMLTMKFLMSREEYNTRTVPVSFVPK